ncbi:MAG TPA: 3,4-dihydroxy-2-butanone-4-phosphate synthase [Acidobacteriaceae bacterium]|nr:3,4-dihydroxy-2-butanone-4-phosphate synthase [Acidobacteriaceae bacterium]
MAESVTIEKPIAESARSAFVDVPTALAEIRAGRMVVVVDDEDRENEGDLTLAAEFTTPEAINFMAKYGRGLICLTLTEERADFLNLPPMTQQNSSRFGTAFTETIEAREGVTTGISAHDRAHTILTAIAAKSTASDLARPGHIFPLRARKGGVLVRAGQTEASVDLARLAGLNPSGVICEIMNDDGTMARVPDLIRFCEEHQMKMLTVAELIRYRLQHERYITRAGETVIHTKHGEFRMIAYESEVNGGESHIALVKGDLCAGGSGEDAKPVLVRVHTKCAAGDLFGAECQCREILDESMRMIAEAGCGALLYLHNTGRGFELIPDAKDATAPAELLTHAQLRARAAADAESCEDHNRRTLRAVGLGGQILYDLGIRRIRLLSNTPLHIPALEGFGLEIVEQTPVAVTNRSVAGL